MLAFSTNLAATKQITVDDNATIAADGLGVGESITVEIAVGAGFVPVYDAAGNAVTLTPTKKSVSIPTPGVYLLSKNATAGVVSCAYYT